MTNQPQALFSMDAVIHGQVVEVEDVPLTHDDPIPAGVVVLIPRHTTELAYEDRYIQPVRTLGAVLSDVLDIDQHPDRTPDEAMSMIKTAVETFADDSADWMA